MTPGPKPRRPGPRPAPRRPRLDPQLVRDAVPLADVGHQPLDAQAFASRDAARAVMLSFVAGILDQIGEPDLARHLGVLALELDPAK